MALPLKAKTAIASLAVDLATSDPYLCMIVQWLLPDSSVYRQSEGCGSYLSCLQLPPGQVRKAQDMKLHLLHHDIVIPIFFLFQKKKLSKNNNNYAEAGRGRLLIIIIIILILATKLLK